MCLSTTDAICRRRAPSRHQVHCAPPFDCQPDCVCFHARAATRPPRLGSFSRKSYIRPFSFRFSNEFLFLLARWNHRCGMWCCKRLDASDWPVTTIVRGNASFLHVANFSILLSVRRIASSETGFSRHCFFSVSTLSFFCPATFTPVVAIATKTWPPSRYKTNVVIFDFLVLDKISNKNLLRTLLSDSFRFASFVSSEKLYTNASAFMLFYTCAAIITPLGQSRESRISSRKVYADCWSMSYLL